MSFVLYGFFSKKAVTNLFCQRVHTASGVLRLTVNDIVILRQIKTSALQKLPPQTGAEDCAEKGKAVVASASAAPRQTAVWTLSSLTR